MNLRKLLGKGLGLFAPMIVAEAAEFAEEKLAKQAEKLARKRRRKEERNG
jgi:hypothetical protein